MQTTLKTICDENKGWLIAGIVLLAIVGVIWYMLHTRSGRQALMRGGKEYLAPALHIERMRMTSLDENTMEAEMTVLVRNKMPVPFHISSMRYTTYLEESRLGGGTRTEPLRLEASGDTRFSLPVTLNLATLKAFSNKDSGSYTVRATMVTDLPFTSDSTVTVNMSFPWLILHLPECSLADMSRIRPGFRHVRTLATYTMRNPNIIPMRMERIRYVMMMDDDREVISKGELKETLDLPAKGSDNITIPMDMRTRTVLKALVKKEARSYECRMSAILTAGTMGRTNMSLRITGRMKDLID